MSDALLTRQECADLLRVPPRTLAQWAYQGKGPPHYRIGKHARYKLPDVLRWLDSQRVEGD